MLSDEQILDLAIYSGADECISNDSFHEIHCNKNEIAIAVGEEAQVAQAYSLGIIKTAAERNAANS